MSMMFPELYVGDVKNGMCAPNNKPKVLKDSASTAWVDGNNTLGAVIGNFCMQLAIDKARSTGVGWVSAKGSSVTNIPTPVRTALGTNPISVAAPANNDDSFVLDMATTAVAVGKVKMLRPIPPTDMETVEKPIPKFIAVDLQGIPAPYKTGNPIIQ
ncbi:hypothetical protein PR048_017790 [Dryococelus australis]|uniref:Uncharacterized protein n=1 Tax=Dryococelus australis TaxID=614101 RepID=A0ABQ9HAK7_9NEOP|nr:hypothetical protein PR048_017790 [Dryococelus australis]